MLPTLTETLKYGEKDRSFLVPFRFFYIGKVFLRQGQFTKLFATKLLSKLKNKKKKQNKNHER